MADPMRPTTSNGYLYSILTLATPLFMHPLPQRVRSITLLPPPHLTHSHAQFPTFRSRFPNSHFITHSENTVPQTHTSIYSGTTCLRSLNCNLGSPEFSSRSAKLQKLAHANFFSSALKHKIFGVRYMSVSTHMSKPS
jgi:hypothetical protein